MVCQKRKKEMQEKNEGKQRDKEKISFIEKYLRETDNWPEVKPGKVISFTKDDITITEDNTI